MHSGISAMLLRRRSLPRGADRPAYEFRILQLRPATLGMTQHRKTKRSGASCNDFGPIEHAWSSRGWSCGNVDLTGSSTVNSDQECEDAKVIFPSENRILFSQ
jgi:hypothetical protein